MAQCKIKEDEIGAVEGTLLYIESMNVKPYVAFGSAPGGGSQTNATYSPHRVKISNARDLQRAPLLDDYGFQLLKHKTAAALHTDAEAGDVGFSEAADIVVGATGAKRVLVFDHTIRRRAPDAIRQPSTRVHGDYTERSALDRLETLTGQDVQALVKRRFAFINVWRPIRWPASDWPLALCDARSAADHDYVATDIVYPDRRGEIFALSYSPLHRWFYFPEMQLDEVVLIKCFDTRKDVARLTPHTAFDNPLTPKSAPARESVEFRTIAFF